MGMIDLGKVKGEDAHFGAINATYTNDGGSPSVNIETDGEDTGKNVTFNFRNLVNDPLSESEIEQITEGNSIQSSNVMNGTRSSALWSKIVEKFAAKLHKHKANDIDEGQFGTDRIEDGAITKNKIAANSVGLNQLDESARDSLSRTVKPDLWGDAGNRSVTMPLATDENGDLYMLIASDDGKLIYRRWSDGTNTNVWVK